MNTSIRRFVVAPLLAIGLVAGLAGAAQAQFVTYDNFDGGFIDPAKWFGFSTEGPFDAPTAEVLRAIEDGRLRLSLVSYGGTTSDTGTVFSRQALGIKQLGVPGGAGFITGVTAKVTVRAAEAQGCPTNPEVTPGTRARASSSGNYFNDGASTGPGDGTGDIGAFFQIQKDNDGGQRIVAGIFRCTNASCGSSTTLTSTVFTTTWALDTPVKFKIVWQPDQGRFRFVANGEAKDVPYPAGVTAAGPTGLNFRNVRVDNTVENCIGDRKMAMMDASFDGIKVQRQP